MITDWSETGFAKPPTNNIGSNWSTASSTWARQLQHAPPLGPRHSKAVLETMPWTLPPKSPTSLTDTSTKVWKMIPTHHRSHPPPPLTSLPTTTTTAPAPPPIQNRLQPWISRPQPWALVQSTRTRSWSHGNWSQGAILCTRTNLSPWQAQSRANWTDAWMKQLRNISNSSTIWIPTYAKSCDLSKMPISLQCASQAYWPHLPFKGKSYMSPFWIYILANLGLFSLICFKNSPHTSTFSFSVFTYIYYFWHF